MCYKCGLCLDVVAPGLAMKKHIVYRPRPGTRDREIAGEIPVCYPCHQLTSSGVSVREVVSMYSLNGRGQTPILNPPPLPEPPAKAIVVIKKPRRGNQG